MNKIEFILKDRSGIYMFVNLTNGKKYVGSSVNIYNRLHEHIHNLDTHKAHNKHFQSAWDKYGKDAFIYSILEYCEAERRFEREQYYIDVIKPEYNLTCNVVANFGHKVSEETKEKISQTLKEKYTNGDIKAYRQEHNWIKTYIYNIKTWKLEAECDCRADALQLVSSKTSHFDQFRVYRERYILTTEKFINVVDLQNFYYQNFCQYNGVQNKYLVTEDNNGIYYHKTLVECARDNFSSKSTLSKHLSATQNNPYIIKQSKRKFYFIYNYIKLTHTAVPIEKSSELLQGNIGEDCDVNTEINLDSNESKSS